ncbi:MAG: hypothetical protein R6V83_09220 [Candidatus Thorarchaeota archaeon]
MQYLKMLSPLSKFAEMLCTYFIEIWDFLILIGRISGAIVVLSGAILWFTEVNIGKGRSLVMSGVILSIVVQYFVMYPPDFVVG